MRLSIPESTGVMILESQAFSDERGTFVNAWSAIDTKGFDPRRQCFATNVEIGTMRGLHYQRAPHGEQKVIRCVAGSAQLVVVDTRLVESWAHGSIIISAKNFYGLYVPPWCACGYVTLAPNTTIEYLIAGSYDPDHATGLRWDDPLLGIDWVEDPRVISAKDRSWPLLKG